MGSTRLPGKMLANLAGKPAVARVFERLGRVRNLDGMILATTTSPKDDPLARWAEEAGLPVFRGSEEDVLDRVVRAQKAMRSDVIVEVTGDTPLLEPRVIEEGIRIYLEGGYDVVSNTWRRSYPDGVDVQVFSWEALAEVARTVHDPAVREHVSLYFYQHPERYRIHHLEAPPAWRRPEVRLLLDTPEDLRFLRRLYDTLLRERGEDFTLSDVLSVVDGECRTSTSSFS